MRLAHRISADISDADLRYLRQLGLEWARVEFGDADPGVDSVAAVQRRFAEHGMTIVSAVHHAYRSLDIQLGRPGRDHAIETYRTFLASLGAIGIGVADYDFHPGNTYSTGEVRRGRGYLARRFDLADFRARVEQVRFGRHYDADEIWAAYAYFFEAALPAAEAADVVLALHPDDPPIPMMNGVAKLFTHADGYRRAEDLAAGSGHWGLTFCVGTWAEGGAAMGADVFAMIEDYGRRGLIADVHLRNVTGPLPAFEETLPDEGYLDLARVVRALHEVGFDGPVVPDHIPRLDGDDGIMRAGTAHSLAYLRGLIDAVTASG
ncbi:mannonate dehydratase [Occultella gossypii]|uniref:mannonate dehydratase n=1 Tax=Occultella gossypii TaxID=2800820 RepID=A0ABS7SK27_9MICO|nr:mannonate dehydratase [Occultella gossypii]MBZ2199706.1 mannonate dehydratase [Occultella gossypii]